MNPFVSVIWDDAWADAADSVGERDHDSKHKPTVMETMGWLVKDDILGVSLFNERCLDKGDELFRSRTFIPRAMIKSVTVYNLTKPRKPKKHVTHHLQDGQRTDDAAPGGSSSL